MELRLLSAVCTAIYIYSSAAMAVSFMPLGDLAGGGFRSIANNVSADGSVVVGYGNSPSGREAFRWTSEDGMQSVASILTTAGPGEHQNDYYDMKITLRSNRKQGASNNESLTDRTKED